VFKWKFTNLYEAVVLVKVTVHQLAFVWGSEISKY